MKKALWFLAVLIVVPVALGVPCGMLLSLIFDIPQGEALRAGHTYWVGFVLGSFLLGKN